MSGLRRAWVMLVVLAAIPVVTAADDVSLVLNPDQVVNRIDEKVYGHFLEHIYHSVNGGLWGELVWNRTFEQNSLGGWTVKTTASCSRVWVRTSDSRWVAADWTDYEFSLEAQKTGGNEGFLVMFRCPGPEDFYWCNLGGWGNCGPPD